MPDKAMCTVRPATGRCGPGRWASGGARQYGEKNLKIPARVSSPTSLHIRVRSFFVCALSVCLAVRGSPFIETYIYSKVQPRAAPNASAGVHLSAQSHSPQLSPLSLSRVACECAPVRCGSVCVQFLRATSLSNLETSVGSRVFQVPPPRRTGRGRSCEGRPAACGCGGAAPTSD